MQKNSAIKKLMDRVVWLKWGSGHIKPKKFYWSQKSADKMTDVL